MFNVKINTKAIAYNVNSGPGVNLLRCLITVVWLEGHSAVLVYSSVSRKEFVHTGDVNHNPCLPQFIVTEMVVFGYTEPQSLITGRDWTRGGHAHDPGIKG